MALLKVICWALIFIIRIRFPPGKSLATILNCFSFFWASQSLPSPWHCCKSSRGLDFLYHALADFNPKKINKSILQLRTEISHLIGTRLRVPHPVFKKRYPCSHKFHNFPKVPVSNVIAASKCDTLSVFQNNDSNQVAVQ